MTGGSSGQPERPTDAQSRAEPETTASGPPRASEHARRLKLELRDPWHSAAREDRPEAWGDEVPDERKRRAEYEENRPPHHG